MLLIKDHWESVDSLNDISRVIREYYNPELADKLDKLIGSNEAENSRVAELEETIEAVRELVW